MDEARQYALHGGGALEVSKKIWKEFLPPTQGEPFVLLHGDPPRPGLWWIPDEPAILDHWVPILSNNFDYLVQLVDEAGGDSSRHRRAEEARVVFRAFLDDLMKGDARDAAPTIHHVTLFRESVVSAFELGDPYAVVKKRETDAALERLTANPEEWGFGSSKGCDGRRLLAQLLSGNLFDLGSALTQKAFREGRMSLGVSAEEAWERAAKANPAESSELSSRGWRGLLSSEPSGETGAPIRRLLILVDNAGADFVLGVLPLAVCLARELDEVILAANTTPSSNDMTLAEVRDVLQRAKPLVGRRTEDGHLSVVGTGTGTPGIDLAHVGADFNSAAQRADALIIDGQGRGVETTWAARFRVPALRVATLKDPEVAGAIGRQLWDPLLVRQLPGEPARGRKRRQDRDHPAENQ